MIGARHEPAFGIRAEFGNQPGLARRTDPVLLPAEGEGGDGHVPELLTQVVFLFPEHLVVGLGVQMHGPRTLQRAVGVETS